jgi:integrase
MFVGVGGNSGVRKGPPARVSSLPRRRPIVGAPGVYYRPRWDGVVGPPYEFRYVDAEGRRRWRVVVGGVAEAQAQRAELAGLCRGRLLGVRSQTFEQVGMDWLARQLVRRRTLETYRWALRRHLIPYFGGQRLEEIAVEDVALFISKMQQQGFKGWTISSVLRPLSIILAQAARKGSIPVNPIKQLERGERPRHDDERPKRILNLEEMRALLRATESGQHRCLFELLLLAGLRIGEALGLTLDDLDREHGIIRIEYQLSREGERTPLKTPDSRRALDIPQALLERLRELVEERGQHDNPLALVFSSRNDTGVTRKTCREALKRAAAAAKLRLPHPTLHDLRHSHASMLIAIDCNLSDVQHRLGHRKPDTTLRIYTHQWNYRDVRKRAIADRLEQLF